MKRSKSIIFILLKYHREDNLYFYPRKDSNCIIIEAYTRP